MSELTRQVARLRVPLGFAFGGVVLALARPTWRSLIVGTAVAAAGETIRIWAAGHLDKGREVTQSGPYRFLAHPLYAGSALMGVGLAIATANVSSALLIVVYLGLTLRAAIRSEESALTRRFGSEDRALPERTNGGQYLRTSLQRGPCHRQPRTARGCRRDRRCAAARVEDDVVELTRRPLDP